MTEVKQEVMPNGFVCWTPDGIELIKDNVGELDETENFILMAVHEPMLFKVEKYGGKFLATTNIIRKDYDDLYQDVDILRTFNEVITTTSGSERQNTFLVTVKGDAGSGKSHLVRWLYENVQELPNVRKVWVVRREDQHLQVMRKFVDDLAELSSHEVGTTSRAQELKARMTRTFDRAESDPKELASELYDSVINILQFQYDLFLDKPGDEKDIRRSLIVREASQGENVKSKLADLLLWREYDDKREHGDLSKLFETVVKDRIGNNIGAPERAKDSRLRFDKEFVGHVLKKYQKVWLKQSQDRSVSDFGDLITQLITHVEIVTDLLNEALEIALTKVLHLGEEDFQVVFAEVREEMARLGQQLLIFLEDFSGVSTGIKGLSRFQQDLLSVFTEVGSTERAPLRVVMAMTPSLWDQLPENIKDRHEFTIDVGRRVEDRNRVTFLSRYLNISRSTAENVERAFKKRQAEDLADQKWVPNACIECPYREDCHNTFGTTTEGIGLYPLNNSVGELLATQIPGEKVVTNRELVRKLRALLSHYTQINEKEFPKKVVADLIVGTETKKAVAISNTKFAQPRPNEDQYKQLARYVQIWKDGKSLPTESEKRVFSLSDYGDLQTQDHVDSSEKDKDLGNSKRDDDRSNKFDEFNQAALYADRDPGSEKPPNFNNETRVRIRNQIFNSVENIMGYGFISIETCFKLLGVKFHAGNFVISGYRDSPAAAKPLSPQFVLPDGEYGKYVLWGALLSGTDDKSTPLSEHDIAQSRACFSEYVLGVVHDLTKLWTDGISNDGGPIYSITKVLKLVHLLSVDFINGDQLDLISRWLQNDSLLQQWVVKVGESEPAIGSLLASVDQLTKDLGPIFGLSESANNYIRIFHINNLIGRLSNMPSDLLKSIFSSELGTNVNLRRESRDEFVEVWRKNIQSRVSVLGKIETDHLNQWHLELTEIVKDLELLFSVPIEKNLEEMQGMLQQLFKNDNGTIRETLDVLDQAVTSIIEVSEQESFLSELKATQAKGPDPDSYLRSLISFSDAKTYHRNIITLAKRISEISDSLNKKNVGEIKLEDVVDLDRVSSVEKVKNFSC